MNRQTRLDRRIDCHTIMRLIMLLIAVILTVQTGAQARDLSFRATIRETQQTIKTYPFSDPSPIPALAINEDKSKFYPYFVWNGFSRKARRQKWKVIHLENPYIKLSVLPQVGGKVWGAIDKGTGKDFIYKNKVLKFRSIGPRGPWTSGGIEHNFGFEGHAPWTASPVDYKVHRNRDGSVSVIVGGLDLASRTQWRVIIKLLKDKAYFETNSLWYNPMPLPQSYNAWENAAVHASDDLQFFYPGRYYIGHDGTTHSWPIDARGRNLSYYKNNDFRRPGHLGNKSYHVMGRYKEWYAAYWHKTHFGFGHWAPHADAMGKKIWIWSLAPYGAIWKHLLTDTSGQYVELQSGVKFNQAAFGSGQQGPFNQIALAPARTDTKHEIWFPFRNTGGIVDASPYGVLNVTRQGDILKIAVNALQALHAPLNVSIGTQLVHSKKIDLSPMQVYRTQVDLPAKSGAVQVAVGRHKLSYNSVPDADNLQRPVRSESQTKNKETSEQLFHVAEDEMRMRRYARALTTYFKILKQEPTHSPALTRIAELYYRRGQYKTGLSFASRALEQNTYDPAANFIYGVLQRQIGDLADAKDGLSVAARSLKFRSGAYVQLASILLQERDFKQAAGYARRALNYNREDLNAYRMLAIAYRRLHEKAKARDTLHQLLKVDPLSHFAQFERYLLEPTQGNLNRFKSMIRNEFPDQTYLELAMTYVHADLTQKAVQVLEEAPTNPIVDYWLAYLTRDTAKQRSQRYLTRASAMSPRFVFPFRLESLPVLKWAMRQIRSWKTKYYLGLIYWSKSRIQKARDLFERCEDVPAFAPFYIARGALFADENPEKAAHDFNKAIQTTVQQWRGWHALIALDNNNSHYGKALNYAGRAYKRFSDNQFISLDYATSLLNNRQYKNALSVLKHVHALPAEGARQGHSIYEKTNILFALAKIKHGDYHAAISQLRAAKKWPEHLGEGRPYDPDNRMEDYLIALSSQRLGRPRRASALFRKITAYTEKYMNQWGANSYVGVLAFKALGQTEKARQLLKAWRGSEHADNQIAQWATATFNGKAHRARRLARALASNGKGKLRWSSGWTMLRQALQELERL